MSAPSVPQPHGLDLPPLLQGLMGLAAEAMAQLQHGRWWMVAIALILLAWLLARIPPTLKDLARGIDRLRELGSRLWRLALALGRELVWVDPERRASHQSRLGPPLNWVASLGFQRLTRADSATEEKAQRHRREASSLLGRWRVVLARHLDLYLILSVLRIIYPSPRLSGVLWRKLVHPNSYPDFPINGMVWLTRNADVRDVMERPDTFLVTYGSRMRDITAPLLDGPSDDPCQPSEKGNFLLGMQTTPRYDRDISNMRLVFRREDSQRCRLRAEADAGGHLDKILQQPPDNRLSGSGGFHEIDLPTQLVIPVAEDLVTHYFGIPVPLHAPGENGDGVVDHQHRWLENLFRYIFYDLKGDAAKERALIAGPRVAQALRDCIDRRRKQDHTQDPSSPEPSDVLGRCLRLQASGTPGMDDETLRINLTGFLVGAMTPLINATCQVMDVLLDRPKALVFAQEAALRDDDTALLGCVMEALRFSPGDPVIYRWTDQDCWVGEGFRRRFIPRGTMVMAWNSSAMFDPELVPDPWDFRPDRPHSCYVHWGHGQHSCAGAYLNMAVIPAMLKPLLRQSNLQRAPGPAGQPWKDGITIRHLVMRFTASQPSVPQPSAELQSSP